MSNDAADPRPWFDSARSAEERIELLLAEMTLEEKAGQLFHAMITAGPGGTLADAEPAFGLPSNDAFIGDLHMTHFNLFGAQDAASDIARWHNALQERARRTRLGIPVTISSDPRNHFSDNPGAAILSGPFSKWPETLGLAAIRDADLVRRFADVARQEYTAVGIRVALHPQVDLATESRWARQLQTFGEDAELTAELGAAYIRGFQGEHLGAASVATMTKHFPGGGPQKDGEDPHFDYGREQVYPGGQFDLHLVPFEAAFAAGTSQIMPYYGMPVGTEHDEVGFAFNKSVITGLLREHYGFDGIVCADWGVINDRPIMGHPYPARAWGLEHLSPHERLVAALDAGVDQFGGEFCPDLVVDVVRDGRVSQERIDVSVRRLLREKITLGLFDDPFVDVDAADAIVGSEPFRAAGEAAQRASITVLTNQPGASGAPTLPLPPGLSMYVEGIDSAVAGAYGTVVTSPADADVAILRLHAPYELRGTPFEDHFHAGSLDFPSDVLAHVDEIAAQVPTIVDVFLDRPAILEPIVHSTAAVVANWGASPGALLDVLTGVAPAQGRLPFDVPRSMAAAQASRPDVPFDTENPLFSFGHGLTL
ncbi:glycoside hydrolase family 3 protein [Microbacterium pygmaeum]|uniref:beta-glucosidase n=1 Tax=Microbacterium pygmaeum TaxID=370764 RepID=A0A1G7U7Z5_9MICO|nr:glycoside hydrolase family 3 N-terminal domain-containing protein [Microbacterium pygmaeum]SDG43518.1 beta-glucosidase [Microbacterium pygmaeum]